ncbi:MAG: sigma-70 family RNA polymerase sigma factor [Phycisphaerales bacterium]
MSTPPNQPDPIAVYRETVAPLYAFVFRRTGGSENKRQLAEDITQETYLRFIAECGRGAHKQPRNPLPWLQTVAHNLLMDHYRRQRPGATDPATLDRMLDGSGEGPSPEAATRAVLWGLARIKPHWAALVASFHLDGKPVAAIAQETNQSERAVEGQLRRARESLRAVLAPHHESNP